MENEIKVGEYCRTKYGEIGKITETFPRLKWRKKKASSDLEYNLIQKHSSNLIDLIQCGDYVNGHLVIDILGDGSGAVYLEQITKGALIPTLKEDIQTIVTKEMMEFISYKVKQEEN